MRCIGLLAGLLFCGVTLGCGDTPSPCEEICRKTRQRLIENFGVAPERVNCSDEKWQGDCQYCKELLSKEFDAVMGECEP